MNTNLPNHTNLLYSHEIVIFVHSKDTMILEDIKERISQGVPIGIDDVENLVGLLATPEFCVNHLGWLKEISAIQSALEDSGGDVLLFTKNILSSLEKTSPRSYALKKYFIQSYALLSYQTGDMVLFKQQVRNYMYNSIAQISSTAINGGMPYFSFRSFSDYSIRDIEEERISLSHPRSFNDPMDTLLNYWLDLQTSVYCNKEESQAEFFYEMKKVAEHIKIRCFVGAKKDDGQPICAENLSTLMWAHYSNSHSGFCVKYDFPANFFEEYKSFGDKLIFIRPVSYRDNLPVNNASPLSMEDALLSKSMEWNYENEKRLIYFDLSDVSVSHGVIPDFPSLDCKGAMKEIYLGVKCSGENRRRIEKAIGDKDIKLFQMNIDNNDPTHLKAIRIG